MSYMDRDFVTKEERDRRKKEGVTETKAARTINMPISYWALLDQIKSKLGKKNTNQTIMFLIIDAGQELGLES